MISESEREQALRTAIKLLKSVRMTNWESGMAAGIKMAVTGIALFETLSRLSTKYGLDENNEKYEADKNTTNTVR